MCSSETIAAGKLAQASKTLILSPISSAPEISTIGDYVYRFYNDNRTAEMLAKYLNKKTSNIALIVENTDYATALRNAFQKLYTGNIVSEQVFNSDEKDF